MFKKKTFKPKNKSINYTCIYDIDKLLDQVELILKMDLL